MKNYFRIAVLGLTLGLLGGLAGAATTSQLNGTVSANISLTLKNPTTLTTNILNFNQAPFTPFIAGTFSYGINGAGVGLANQLFVGQWILTNGALVGTNWINLNTPTNAAATALGASTNDAFGNQYSFRNIKFIAFQNLGIVGGGTNNNETNSAYVTVPSGAIAWTNQYGGTFAQCTVPGPPPLLNAPNSTNTPIVFFWAPGDVGYQVGLTASNTIVLTNPVPTGPPIMVNVYIIGSSGQ